MSQPTPHVQTPPRMVVHIRNVEAGDQW